MIMGMGVIRSAERVNKELSRLSRNRLVGLWKYLSPSLSPRCSFTYSKRLSTICAYSKSHHRSHHDTPWHYSSWSSLPGPKRNWPLLTHTLRHCTYLYNIAHLPRIILLSSLTTIPISPRQPTLYFPEISVSVKNHNKFFQHPSTINVPHQPPFILTLNYRHRQPPIHTHLLPGSSPLDSPNATHPQKHLNPPRKHPQHPSGRIQSHKRDDNPIKLRNSLNSGRPRSQNVNYVPDRGATKPGPGGGVWAIQQFRRGLTVA